MRFIDKEDRVQVQIANLAFGSARIMADFNIAKENFEEFLDHVIEECKKAYQRDELFPSIRREQDPVVKTVGTEYCKQCPHHRIINDCFFICTEADSQTGKTIPTEDWVEGIIPSWCPLET